LESSPARLSGSMCVRITIAQRSKPIRFCNTYVGAGGGPQDSDETSVPGGALVSDLADALADLDAFKFGRIRVTGVDVNFSLERGLRQAYMTRASGPRFVRRGQSVRLRV